MIINQVSFLVKSSTLAADEITMLMQGQPTWYQDIGAPVDYREPDGPRRTWTNWAIRSRQVSNEVADHILFLQPAILAFGLAKSQVPSLYGGMWMMVYAGPAGALFGISPEDMSLLASAGCEIAIDAYAQPQAAPDAIRGGR